MLDQIAGFIFGKNTAVGKDTKQTVAMTSPVRMELQVSSAQGCFVVTYIISECHSTYGLAIDASSYTYFDH